MGPWLEGGSKGPQFCVRVSYVCVYLYMHDNIHKSAAPI